MAWLIDDDDDLDLEIVNSSPVAKGSPTPFRLARDDDSIEFVEPPVSPPKPGNCPSQSDLIEVSKSPKVATPCTTSKRHSNPSIPSGDRSEDIEVISNSNPSDNVMTDSSIYQSVPHPPSRRIKEPCTSSLSPVIWPRSPVWRSESEQDMLDPSFPVRPIAKQRKRQHVAREEGSPVFMPPPIQHRLHRRHKLSPVQRVPRERTDFNLNYQLYPLLDIAAVQSGDETSEGSSGPENDIEDESDRLFLQQVPETQVSPSYDQSLAYRQSLFTQAPAGSKAPVFANRPVRHGIFGNGGVSSRRGPIASSSPPNSDPDEYAFGSFVVDDEAEISYISSE